MAVNAGKTDSVEKTIFHHGKKGAAACRVRSLTNRRCGITAYCCKNAWIASAGEWTRRRILVTFDFAGYYALQVRTWVEAPSRPTEKWSLGLSIIQRGSDRMRSNFLAICPSRGELIQELSFMTADRMLECLDGLIRSWIRSDDD